jgi:nitrogenase-associated protein
MATVTFYEKPGCINNSRQKKKKLLKCRVGNAVLPILFVTAFFGGQKSLPTLRFWQPERLRPFFGKLADRSWFNYSTPAIKQSEIEAENLTEHEALALMVKNPLLIRRPLMQVGARVMAGFDQYAGDNWIGLKATESYQNIESRPRPLVQAGCGHE